MEWRNGMKRRDLEERMHAPKKSGGNQKSKRGKCFLFL